MAKHNDIPKTDPSEIEALIFGESADLKKKRARLPRYAQTKRAKP